MKRPKGAPSRSVNPLQKLKEEMIRRASADRISQEQAVRQMGLNRLESRSKELEGRGSKELSEAVASRLNRMGTDETPLSARGLIETLGVIDPQNITPADIRSQMGSDRGQVARALAQAEGPGMRERVARARAGLTGMLAEDGTRGDIARAGVVTAATGGSVMGLTAAGQGLMALMEYIQNGTQQQEQRESTLG